MPRYTRVSPWMLVRASVVVLLILVMIRISQTHSILGTEVQPLPVLAALAFIVSIVALGHTFVGPAIVLLFASGWAVRAVVWHDNWMGAGVLMFVATVFAFGAWRFLLRLGR